jgi:hypothetical protein
MRTRRFNASQGKNNMDYKKYRVEIVSIETGEVSAVIGKGLGEKQKERRIKTGLMRTNLDKYFVREVEE